MSIGRVEGQAATAVLGRELRYPARRFVGAAAHRAVHTGKMSLSEHSHDRASLVIHLLGAYRELNDAAEEQIDGPAAVYHPPGSRHAEEFSQAGAEVLIIHFDPRFFDCSPTFQGVSRVRRGGAIASRARALARFWLDPAQAELALREATACFLSRLAVEETPNERPRWLDHVVHALEREKPPSTSALADRLQLHPAWLARAYRAFAGEGLSDTARRIRVERAITLLRASQLSLAEIAVTANFWDQSHMNRCVRALTGRTPAEIRQEAAGLARGLSMHGNLSRACMWERTR